MKMKSLAVLAVASALLCAGPMAFAKDKLDSLLNRTPELMGPGVYY